VLRPLRTYGCFVKREDWDAVPREGEEVDVVVAHTDPLSISSSIGHLSSFT
jgi:hypothetical protein